MQCVLFEPRAQRLPLLRAQVGGSLCDAACRGGEQLPTKLERSREPETASCAQLIPGRFALELTMCRDGHGLAAAK